MLTQERVRELFNLCLNTGALTRRIAPTGRTKIGEVVGRPCSRGYLTVRVDGRLYYLHRIVYLHVHGYMPEHGIDHINRDKLDNRPCNLREVSHQCNLRNCKLSIANKSNVRGVYRDKKRNRWIGMIKLNHKSIYLGAYKDFVDAVAARLIAEQCLNWSGCDSNSPAFQYMQSYLKENQNEKDIF